MPGVAAQVNVVFVAETASYSASVKAAAKTLGVFEAGTKTAGATARKEMTEARGAVAVLGEEIGVHLPRHVQKFVAGLPGVASAMSAAFSAVAVIAIGEAVFEAGKKIYEFAEKNEDAARKNRAAWEESGRALDETVTELQLSNVQLANQIALLEGKPQNKLLEAMMETRLETERLDDKFQAAIKSAQELLEKTAPGMLSELFLGTKSTGEERSMVSEHSRWLNLAQSPEEILSESKSFGGALEKRLTELEKKQQTADKLRETASSGPNSPSVPGFVVAPNFKAEIDAVKDLISRQRKEQAIAEGMITQDALQPKLENVRAMVEAADTAAREALAKAMKTVEGRVNELVGRPVKIPEAGLEAMRMEKQPVPDSLSNVALQFDEDTSPVHYGERWKGYNDAVMQGFEAQSKFRSELALTKLGLDESTGAVSRHAAAIQRMAIEDRDYKSQASYIGNRMDQVRSDTTLTAPQQAQELQQLQNQLDRVLADQKIHDLVAANEIKGSSPFGELHDRAMELAQQFTNLGDHMSNFTVRTLDAFNETLLRTLSTPASFMRGQHPWRNLGSTVAQQAGGSALQYAEGSFMKSVPGLEKLFGKAPKGTSADLLHVSVDRMMVAGGLASSTASAIGGVTGKVGNAVSAAMSLFHIPGFAEGGMIPSNMPAMVGENGPELLMPVGQPRQVVPNGGFGVGGVEQHFHFDNRGAGDPAAVEAAANRAVLRHAPMFREMAISTIRNHNGRVSSKARI